MTATEKIILNNQTVIMNALAGLYVMKKFDNIEDRIEDPKVKEQYKKTVENTTMLLVNGVTTTQAILKKDSGKTEDKKK